VSRSRHLIWVLDKPERGSLLYIVN